MSVFCGIMICHAESEARRKARYYYSAGVAEEAAGNLAQSYDYFKKAHHIDPSYAEAASAFGTRRLYNHIDTLQSLNELDYSLSLMKPYVDQYPDDVFEALNYGYVAGQLGHYEDAVKVLERSYSLHPESSNILLQLSDVYAGEYDLDNAIDAIDRYEKAEGLSSAVTTRKLSYLLANEDTVRALSEVTRLVKSNPTDVSFRILKGNLYDIIQMPDSAFVYYSQAEALDPESGMAKFALAGYYQQKGDSVMYDNKIYEVLLSEDLGLDGKADLLSQYLETLLRDNHDSARGDHLFSVLQSQYPHEPRVLDIAARYSAAKGDYADAEEQISYAIDQDPTNLTYWGQLMTYQASGDNPKSALDTYDKAKEHVTPDVAFNLVYASVAQMTEEYDRAVDVYKELIHDIDSGLKLDSLISLNDVRKDISMRDLDMLSSYFTMMGDVYNLAGQKDDSYLSYENAITLNSSNNMAKNNYAYFMAKDGGDLEKALQLSGESLSGRDSDNPTYLDTYAWINYLKGNLDIAYEYQTKALEIQGDAAYPNAELYDHYGDILIQKGMKDEALESWKKAAEIMEDRKETDDPSYNEILEKIKKSEK